MTHTALIKIAPLFSIERFDDPKWNRPGRLMFDPGSLILSRVASVPLIVDHDGSRETGPVHELFKLDWTDGPWIAARATVDTPPSWLKRGTPASFELKVLHRRKPNIRGVEAEIVARAIVTEVSLLSPGVRPVEPLAEVVSYRLAEAPSSPAAVSTSDRAAAGEVIYGDGKLVRRYYDNAVLAVGGRPVQTSSGLAIRRMGGDYIVDQPDGSQVIYSGAEGYREALRDGVAV